MPETEPLTPEVLTEEDAERAQKARRDRVLQLHLTHIPQTQIASLVSVNQSTVSRDLQWWKGHWRLEYGPNPLLNAAEEIGEAVELYKDAEGKAMREFHKSEVNTRGKMACLRTAMDARERRITLLQDVGLIEREMGTVRVEAARADDIRTLLRKHGLLTDTQRFRTLGTGEEGEVDEDVQAWMKQGEAS